MVSNTPYEELTIPKNAENVVVTFATSPENIKVTAGVLFGGIVPEGVWPLEKPYADEYEELLKTWADRL